MYSQIIVDSEPLGQSVTGRHNRRRVGIRTTGAAGADYARGECSRTRLSLLLVERRKQFRALPIVLTIIAHLLLLLLHRQVGDLRGSKEVVVVVASRQLHGVLGLLQQLLHALTQPSVVRAVEQQVVKQCAVFRLREMRKETTKYKYRESIACMRK